MVGHSIGGLLLKQVARPFTDSVDIRVESTLRLFFKTNKRSRNEFERFFSLLRPINMPKTTSYGRE
jgi:hypothetical protein